jgi:proline iminopeptidase
MQRRSGEPWYAEALSAAEKADAGDDSPETRNRWLPFMYGRWDRAAREHSTLGLSERARAVRARYYADGVFDPPDTVAALARLRSPVLVYGGELDLIPVQALEQAAGLFPHGELAVQPGAGHFPWLDDPVWFSAALNAFLG